MPDVVRAINRLAQGTQHDCLQQLDIRAGLYFLEQPRIVLRLRIVTTGELQPEFPQELAQHDELFRSRALVHAKQRRMIVAGKEVGSADVGSQHALLDQTVRVVALGGNDALDLAFAVEKHVRLDGFEVDRTAQRSGFHQFNEECVQCLQMRHQILELARGGALPVFDGLGYLGIGQPGARMHHRRIETIIAHLAARRDIHLADHAQAVNLGHE